MMLLADAGPPSAAGPKAALIGIGGIVAAVESLGQAPLHWRHKDPWTTVLACCNAERRTGRPSATSGGRRSRGVLPGRATRSLGMRVVSVRRGVAPRPSPRSAGASFASGPSPDRLAAPRRLSPRPGRGGRHRRWQRRARRDRRRQRPLERPAGPSTLNALTFNQPTVVYDRTGTVVLGTFQQERRRVVASTRSPGSSSTPRPRPRTARSGRTPVSTRRRSSPRSPRTRSGAR